MALRAFHLGVYLLICMVLSAFAQTDSQATIRGLIERFFAAYQREDVDEVMSLWSERSPDFVASKRDFKQLFANHKIAVSGLNFGKTSIEADQAKVQLTMEVSAVNARTGKSAEGFGRTNRTMWLVKEADGWKIWKYTATEEGLAADLIAAQTSPERSALLEANKELVTIELVKALDKQGRELSGQGQFTQALAVFDTALSIANQLQDGPGLIATWRLMGIAHYWMNNYTQALACFQKSLTLSEAGNDKPGIRNALRGIGNTYNSQGNYVRASEYQGKSLKLSEELGDKTAVALDLNNIGLLYSQQGTYEQALEYFKRSLKIKEEVNNRAGIALTLDNIGVVYGWQGKYEQALEAFQKSLKLCEELGEKAGIADALHNIAVLHYLRGDYAQALTYNRRSLELAQDNYLIAHIQSNMGETYLKMRQYAFALEFAERAAESAARSDLNEMYWEARTIAGKAHLALNQPEQAEKAFLDAIHTIEKLRQQVAGGEQERERFFEGKVSPYYEMVELLIARNNLPEALAYAERAKGRVLLDVLNNGRSNITKAMTNDEINRDRALTAEIVSLNRQIARQNPQSKPGEPEMATLNARLEKARLEYETFQTNLYALHPELKIQRGQTQQLTLKQAAELLPDNQTALLEYVITEDKAYLFVMTKSASSAEHVKLPLFLKVYTLNIKSKDLAEMAEAFRQKAAERDLTVKKPAQQLYDRLVRPAESQLQGIHTLCIVPDGALWSLPFQALHQGKRGYLLERFAIFYAPSLSVLREMVRKGNEAKALRSKPARINAGARPDAIASESKAPELLAVGNPALSGKTMTKIKSTYRNETFSPLPDAEREVKTLGQLYGLARSKVLTGNQAREETVKAEAGRYSVLHLATHAIIDDDSPMYSRIMLSDSPGDNQEDGMLEAWELMKLDLRAELVVLSACQTARGRVAAGEGIIGMSWALFVAGSPAVIVTQWKVDSARSADMMVEFHRQLRSHALRNTRVMTKSEALRQAALKLLRGPFNHPAFWAGFILIGYEK
jgi:CHAT domain-containing protein/Tfp pilus assembly protein PilF/ketosteroid isomerase-like protein